jgi:pimeloyl-ACP methyl ester carboxylesterase
MGFNWRKKALVIGGISVLLIMAAGHFGLYYFRLGPEGQYFDSNGVRIHFSDEGAGTPVVLVHGLSATAHVEWRAGGKLDALARHYRVITLDSRGHGRSDKPHSPDQYGAEMAEDLARLLDHLKIRQAHVVGYSLGGFITLKFVASHPDRVLSAAVCASGWGWQRPTPENVALLENIAREFEDGKAELILTRLRYIDRPLNVVERLAIRTGIALSNDRLALAAAVRGIQGLDVTEEQLRANKVPVLTLVGDKDGLFPDAQALHEHLANNTLVVLPGADHGSTGGDAAFLRNLETFLENNSTRPLASSGATGGLD